MTSLLLQGSRLAWLTVVLAATSLWVGRAAPLLLAAAVLVPLSAPLLPRIAHNGRRRLHTALLFYLFSFGCALYHQPGSAVDLFEDGQILTPASVYAAGGHPYVDTYPIHGWGADGGVDGLLFRIFGVALRVFWWRRTLLTAMALVFLAFAAFALFRSLGWSSIAFLLCLAFCPFLSERHVLVLPALATTIHAGGGQRVSAWSLAGAISAATLFFTLDFGLMAIAAGLASALILPALALEKRRRLGVRELAGFIAGAVVASLPFGVLLAQEGSLGAFFRVSFLEIPRTVTDAWGLPAPMSDLLRSGPTDAFRRIAWGEEGIFLFLVLLLAAGWALLLLRAAQRRFDSLDRRATVALLLASFALRGVLGRADSGHFALYGVFGGLPAAWILYRAARARSAGLLVALLLLVFARLHPHRILALEEGAITGARTIRGASRQNAPTPAERQKAEIAPLRSYFDSALAPDQTFIDFANEPALYFLLCRRPPIRYAAVPLYEGPDQQNEVLVALERVRPPLAIFSAGAREAFDGVSNRQRAPRVAAYLDAHYSIVTEIAGRKIARRRSP